MMGAYKKRKFILASASPRRSALLKKTGLNFKIVKSHIDEHKLIKRFQKKSHRELAKLLSFHKALSVSTRHDLSLHGNEIILGFDTMVICKNKIIEKPKNKNDALKKILFLSGKSHKVYTGICLLSLQKGRPKKGKVLKLCSGRKIFYANVFLDYDLTMVTMKQITKSEALNYIKTGEPFGKAGAYAVQGIGKKFIKNIKGDYFNVVGMPLNKFNNLLMMSLKQ